MQLSLTLVPERHPILQKGLWAHALVRPASHPAAQRGAGTLRSWDRTASTAYPRTVLSDSTGDILDQIILIGVEGLSCTL